MVVAEAIGGAATREFVPGRSSNVNRRRESVELKGQLMPHKNFDDEDVKAALEKTDTGDGPGTDNLDGLPESDFVAFAEDDVENDAEDSR
ncbi:hypothetical protein [Streptomyces sp. NPDC003720]|uniref:hypothetical protein n=1 Tax=Streptomyces sp. NPDC003720 TaxID=3364684 RepID=UPI0036768C65